MVALDDIGRTFLQHRQDSFQACHLCFLLADPGNGNSHLADGFFPEFALRQAKKPDVRPMAAQRLQNVNELPLCASLCECPGEKTDFELGQITRHTQEVPMLSAAGGRCSPATFLRSIPGRSPAPGLT